MALIKLQTNVECKFNYCRQLTNVKRWKILTNNQLLMPTCEFLT